MNTDVVARGQGSSAGDWARLMYRNSVLVVLKHQGSRATVRSLVAMVLAALLAFAKALSPTASSRRRRELKTHGVSRLAAVPSVVAAILRDARR